MSMDDDDVVMMDVVVWGMCVCACVGYGESCWGW